MNKIIKLRDVLLNSESYVWSDALFLMKDEVWILDSKCTVLDPNDVEDDADEEPRFAAKNNMIYALSIQDIQSVVENATEQNAHCIENDLLQAFLYYFNNDAFIEFDVT